MIKWKSPENGTRYKEMEVKKVKRTCKESTLAFEISEQDLAGKNGAGDYTSVQATIKGHCGGLFTTSYECTKPHRRCA